MAVTPGPSGGRDELAGAASPQRIRESNTAAKKFSVWHLVAAAKAPSTAQSQRCGHTDYR